jgi:MoxR-like ATPase
MQNSFGDPRGSDFVDLASQRATLAELRENIARGVPSLIVGDRGAGKSTLAERAARLCGRSVETFHLGGVHDAEAFLFGQVVLRDGGTRFVRSRFVESLCIPDLVLVLDELNRASAVHNALLSVLDHQRRLILDLEESDRRVVDVASGVVLIATANHGAEFCGVEPVDAALLDRFSAVRVGFPDEEDELLVARTGVAKERATDLVRVAREIRAQFARGALPCTISTRRLLDAAALLALGRPIETAIERSCHVYDGDGLAALRTTVRAVLGKKS